jgi:hypothetical protein
MQTKTVLRFHYAPIAWIGSLTYCWEECHMEYLVWKTVLQSLKKLNIILLLKSIIPIGTCSIDLKIIFTKNLEKIFVIILQSFQTGINEYLRQ